MAQASHEPTDQTRRTVESMSAYGIPQERIASVIGVDSKTLRKHYRDELDNAETKANAKVAESLYRKATGEGQGAVTAAIFWLKTRAGWRDVMAHEHSGPDGGAIETVDWSRVDTETMRKLMAARKSEAQSE